MPSFMDPALWAANEAKILFWLLVATRMTGLMAMLPALGQERMPLAVRTLLVVLMSAIVAPVLTRPAVVPSGFWVLAPWLAFEFATGMLLGLLVAWVVEAVSFAGQLMDTQMGFAFAQLVDPFTAQSASVSGTLLVQMTLLFILASGLHQTMIMALVESYRIVPVGQGLPLKAPELVAALGQMLVRGFQLAFPVLITLFFVDVLEGIAAKLMPQLQLIQLSFPIKITVGLLILAYLMRELSGWLTPLLQRAPVDALRLLV